MSLSTTSTYVLNTSRDGDSTTSLGSLFQCLTMFFCRYFFLLENFLVFWLENERFSLSSMDLGGFLKKKMWYRFLFLFPKPVEAIGIISYIGTWLASVPTGIRYLRVRHLNRLTNCLLTKRFYGISHSAHMIVFLTCREYHYSCQRTPRPGRSKGLIEDRGVTKYLDFCGYMWCESLLSTSFYVQN